MANGDGKTDKNTPNPYDDFYMKTKSIGDFKWKHRTCGTDAGGGNTFFLLSVGSPVSTDIRPGRGRRAKI